MQIISLKKLFNTNHLALFNFGVWTDSNSLCMLGRESNTTQAEDPDITKLVSFRLSFDLHILEKYSLWNPQDNKILIEDPRVLKTKDNTLIVGLTVVQKIGKRYMPYGAFIKLDNLNPDFSFPEPFVMKNLGIGKDVTPIDERILLFREFDQKDENSAIHKMAIVEYQNNENGINKIGYIDFPSNLDWAKWRIGTTMPPYWINNNEALFIIHGINDISGQYIYSLGFGRLTRKGDKFEASINPEPLLTPDEFESYLGEKVIERFPHRRVLYCCGGRVTDDLVYLYLNAGDQNTYEISYPKDKLL